jgi:glycosyltransferase involved in cell wall biosynthesis
MRVLCVATAYPRHPGDGVTPWLPELIRRLATRGVAVEVLASAHRGLGDQVVDGVPVHRFRYAPSALETLTHDRSAPARLRERPAMAALVPGYLAAATVAAARLARSGRFDLVHALWPLPHALPAAAAAATGGVPLVCTFFGSELAWRGWRRRAAAPLVRAAVRASAVVTVISSYTARLLTELAPTARPLVVPLGATIPSPAAAPQPERARGAPFELLYAGRLVARKGVHVLLDAVAELATHPSAPPITLHVVGEGPERARLEARAARPPLAGRVVFHGFVPREVLARRLAACDAVVLPTLADVEGDVEGLGLPVLEALGHARAVVASDTGGIVDLVRDSDTGLLVPPGDAAALARALGRLAAEPALGRALGARGRAYAEAGFAWDGVLDRWVDAYAAALAWGLARRTGSTLTAPDGLS